MKFMETIWSINGDRIGEIEVTSYLAHSIVIKSNDSTKKDRYFHYDSEYDGYHELVFETVNIVLHDDP